MELTVESNQPIQAAIDTVHANGGGRVVLAPGSHHTGTVYMKSNVNLHLPAGARLRGSSRLADYADFNDPGLGNVAPEKSRKCLIAAAHAENIAITGNGEINGSGPAFFDTSAPGDGSFGKPPHPRPRMVQLYNCSQVRIEGVSFIDSPNWTFWLIGCRNVNIHRIRIEGCPRMNNNDGIDIDGCQRVTVSDCLIRTGDDCLVLRAIRKQPQEQVICENVVVSNCVLDSHCQGIRIGCPSDDTIRNCSFSNLVIEGRGHGIHINNPKRYLRPGCNGYLDLQHLHFDNIIINTDKFPVAINVEAGIKLRHLRNLSFSNLTINSKQPCRLQGSTDTVIENISFNQVKTNHAIEVEKCRNISLHQLQIDSP